MKILFTGASSFSGMWFVKELAEQGHEVTAIFKRHLNDYSGIRRLRVDQVLPLCISHFNISFGDEAFLELLKKESFDLFCHHAADVTDYRSPNFDVGKAVASNTRNIKTILELLKHNGCQTMVLTGSVFEQNEGVSLDSDLPAISPYGLSKGLTSEVFNFYSQQLNIRCAKFVIPNPFGPYEEGRFTNYLAQNWLQTNTPAVNTPMYIRDNIPVTLLAKAYAHYISSLKNATTSLKYNPSYYVFSQGEFTSLFAKKLSARFNKECLFELKHQTDFPEPLKRINSEPIDSTALQWDEELFWDKSANYYQMIHLPSYHHATK